MNNTDVLPTSSTSVALDLFAAVLAGDADRASPFVTDDVVLRVPGSHALAGEHVGLTALMSFVEGSSRLTDDGEHIEVLDVLTGGEHVAVYCCVTATRAGREPLRNLTLHLARVVDGRVTEIALHNHDDESVNAFWS